MESQTKGFQRARRASSRIGQNVFYLLDRDVNPCSKDISH